MEKTYGAPAEWKRGRPPAYQASYQRWHTGACAPGCASASWRRSPRSAMRFANACRKSRRPRSRPFCACCTPRCRR